MRTFDHHHRRHLGQKVMPRGCFLSSRARAAGWRRLSGVVVWGFALGWSVFSSVVLAAPPANDAQSAAVELADGEWTTGTTAEATSDPGEILVVPALSSTVWYGWTASASEFVEVRVRSTDGDLRFHPGLAVLVAPGVDDTQMVETSFSRARRELGETDRALRFRAIPGTRYLIQVAGLATEGIAFQLRLRTLADRATGDDFGSAAPVAAGTIVLPFDNATLEEGEPPTFQAGPSVWRHWTVPETGWYLVTEISTEINDIDVFRGASLGSLVRLKANLPSAFPSTSRDRSLFHASAGESLYFRFSSNDEGNLSAHLGPPVKGDVFSDPHDLGSVENVQITRRISPLNRESDEPEILVGSLWFTWVCPKDGMYRAQTTTGSRPQSIGAITGYSPGAMVYRGDTFDTLTPVPCVPLGGYEELLNGIVWEPRVFRATAGTRYRFLAGISTYVSFVSPDPAAAESSTSDTGLDSITFRLASLGSSPPNDNFAQAGTLNLQTPGREAIAEGRTSGATLEDGEQRWPGEAGDSVWHRVAIPETGNYEVTFQTDLTLFYQLVTGDSLETLHYSYAVRALPRQQVAFEEGDTFWFRIFGSRLSQQGAYTLGIRRTGPLIVPPPLIPVDLGSQAPVHAEGVTGTMDTQKSAVLWRWTAPQSGWYRIGSSGPAEDTHLNVTSVVPPAPMAWLQSSSARFLKIEAGHTYTFLASTSAPPGTTLSLELAFFAEAMPLAAPPETVDLGQAAVASTPLQPLPVWTFAYTDFSQSAIWTAPASGWYAFDTEGSTGNIDLHIQAVDPESAYRESSAYSSWRWRHRRDFFSRRWEDAPAVTRLLYPVEAGESYVMVATPRTPGEKTADWEWQDIDPPARVKLNLQPASGPPVVTGIQFRPVPAAAPGLPRFMEAVISVDSPNGLIEGCLSVGPGLHPDTPAYYYFAEPDRIAGDTFSGSYRLPLPTAYWNAAGFRAWLQVRLTDVRGGYSERSGRELAPLVFGLDDSLFTMDHDFELPVLEGVLGLPPVLTLGDSGTPLRLRFGIGDSGGSGFDTGEIFLEPPANEVSGLTGAALTREGWRVFFDGTHRVRGSAQAGVYEVPVTIPAAATGSLRLRLRHKAGNTPRDISGPEYVARLWQLEAASLALPTTLERVTPADTNPPAIVPAEASYEAAAGEWGRLTAAARLTDGESGLEGGSVSLVDVNDTREIEVPFSASERVSGTAADGVYRVDFDAPPLGLGGAHWVVWKARDASGLVSRAAWPVEGSLPDRRNADRRKPQLTSFRLSPSVVDLTRGPATVTAVLAASDDRPGLAARCQIFSDRGDLVATRDFSSPGPSLDATQTIELPQLPAVGPTTVARVVVGLVDSAGRTEVYGLALSPAWPDPGAPTLHLAPEPSPAMDQWMADFPGLPTAPADATRDTDGDGWPDALEFFLNLDPLAPAAADPLAGRLPQWRASIGVTTHSAPQPLLQVTSRFRFTLAPWVKPSATDPGGWFTKSYEADGWRLQVEESNDLRDWFPRPLPVERQSDRLTLDRNRLLPAPPAFVRLRVLPP